MKRFNLLIKWFNKYGYTQFNNDEFVIGIDYSVIPITRRKDVFDTIKFKQIKSLKLLCLIYEENKKYGSSSSLEKYIHLYGEEEGNRRFKNKKSSRYTLETSILKYGEEEGTRRFKNYCLKQAQSNSFEYKSNKYNMSLEEFDMYNKSRAVTLDNMIKRYGKYNGKIKFNKYRERQRFTNSSEYLGEHKYISVNKQKSHSYDTYLARYGDEDIAKEKYIEFHKKTSGIKSRGYSKISQELADYIYNNLLNDREKDTCYYATKNHEYVIFYENKVFKYDFVCTSLKLCIEFNGDVYHGNPLMFSPDDYLTGWGCTNILVKDKWAYDDYKNNIIKQERKYDVIVIWEYDYRTNKDKIHDKLGVYIDTLR